MLGIAAALVAVPAIADMEAARAARAAGDYSAALRELQAPELATDPAALLLLGEMAIKGEGAPADPVQAYAFLTQAMMFGSPDDWGESGYGRRSLARGMSDAQIRDGEARVVAWVDGRNGQAARAAAVEALRERLESCDVSQLDGCRDAAEDVFRYGPAAPELVPAIEALMTRDPYWLNREKYAYALVAIGSAGAPALGRVMLDQAQLRKEGGWNAAIAAAALGELGAAARAELPGLLEAASRPYDDLSTASTDMQQSLGMPDMASQIRSAALEAIIRVGDPDRTIHSGLLENEQKAPDAETATLFGLTIGMIYGEAEPAIARVRASLAAKDGQNRGLALMVIIDFARRPALHAATLPLAPVIRQLTHDPDPEVSSLASAALAAMAETPTGP